MEGYYITLNRLLIIAKYILLEHKSQTHVPKALFHLR